MLYAKLYVLHKLHVNSSFMQYSVWKRVKCENLKSLKLNQNIETLKQYFKIFAYEEIWKILTLNILTLFRDDLRSDIPPVTDEVVSF